MEIADFDAVGKHKNNPREAQLKLATSQDIKDRSKSSLFPPVLGKGKFVISLALRSVGREANPASQKIFKYLKKFYQIGKHVQVFTRKFLMSMGGIESPRGHNVGIPGSQWEVSRKLLRVRNVFVGIPIIRGKDDYPYSFFSLTDFTPPLSPSLVEDMADLLVYHGNFQEADLIVSEADRGGGPLAQAVAVRTGQPYTLANWYPEEVRGQIAVKASVGFSGTGFIYLNGITPGQKVILIDDLLSSGGTAIALIEAIEQVGAKVIEALFVGEKLDLGGRKRISQKYDIPIKTLVQFTANGGDKTKLVSEDDWRPTLVSVHPK